MTDAPERLWAEVPPYRIPDVPFVTQAWNRSEAGLVEYVRADLYAVLEADIEEYKQMHYHDRQKIKRLEADRDEYKLRLIAELRDSAKLLYDLNDHDNAGRNEDAADALEEGGDG